MTTETQHLPVEEMDTLGDIFVGVRAELDQSTFTMQELLALEPGTLVPLARPTGENVDVYAEEVLIGWGEVLLSDSNMSVRIASVRNPSRTEPVVASPADTRPGAQNAD